jgi:hypothetical protein
LCVPAWLTLTLEDQAGWLPWAEVQTFGMVILLALVVRDVAIRSGAFGWNEMRRDVTSPHERAA